MSFGNAGVTYTPCSFLTPRMRWRSTSSIIIARSRRSASLRASPRYMKTVMNGACPFVVMSVTTWYWIVWTPFLTSLRTRFSTTVSNCSGVIVSPVSASSASSSFRIAWREISTNGARCVSEIDWPPYWFEATCAMICVAMLHAVEKLFGFSIIVPEMTVPFCSMSSRLTRSQLCICCA